MTGEAHGAVVTDPAVNTQMFLWHEGCIYIYIFYLFVLAVLGLHCGALALRCCARAFLSCSKQGFSWVVVDRLLIAVASLAAEHRSCGTQA